MQKISAQASKTEEYRLFQDLELVQRLIHKEIDEKDIEIMSNYASRLEAKIQIIREQKVKAAAFRAKAKWIREGETNTKYFFALEKKEL